MRTVYLNGEYLPLSEAKVSVLDRGFLFADGIYEVCAVIGGRLVDNAAHLARLERSSREIELALPVTPTELESIMETLVARNNVEEGGVYVQVTRGVAERDFSFPEGVRSTLVLFTQAKDLVNAPEAKTGIEVITTPELRWIRRDIKSVALLGQVLAKQAAAKAGVGEALFVEDGLITEGASSSVFMLSASGEIYTRKTDHTILPGITRKAVMALASEAGFKITERAFTPDEAKAAREVFITSASTIVMPVIAIDGDRVGDGGPGPAAKRLRELYIEFAMAG